MNGMGWINDLKLRIGAGQTGNSAIAPYATQGPATSLFYPFYTSSAAGSIPNRILANRNWGGKKRLNITSELISLIQKQNFRKYRCIYFKDYRFINEETYSICYSFDTTFANIGETANTGVDITLTTVNIKQKDLTWTTTTTAAWQKEHIETLSNGKQDDISNTWFIDQPIGVIYGYRAIGLWQARMQVKCRHLTQMVMHFLLVM
jgi:hypothetical protein